MAGSPPNVPEPPRVDVGISAVNPAASEMVVQRAVVPTPVPPPAPAPAAPTAPVQTIIAASTPLPPMDFHGHIDEFAANVAGGLSPFGDEVEFPLPAERLGYRHPGPANRPALAGD